MIKEALQLMSSQANRPFSFGSALISLVAPSALVIFLDRPQLYSAFGVNGVVLLSIAISFPILALWYAIVRIPATDVQKWFRVATEYKAPTDLDVILKMEDPWELHCLAMAGWLTNVTLFSVAGFAYYRPLRIGATFLSLAAVLFALWIVVLLVSHFVTQDAIETLKKRKTRAAVDGAIESAANRLIQTALAQRDSVVASKPGPDTPKD